MTPMFLGGPEIAILAVVALALLIFGGGRLAGLGKGTGKAIREFKEETASLRAKENRGTDTGTTRSDAVREPRAEGHRDEPTSAPRRDEVVDAEVVEPQESRRDV